MGNPKSFKFKSLFASSLLAASMLVAACGGDDTTETGVLEEEAGVPPAGEVQEVEPQVGVDETEGMAEEQAEVAPAEQPEGTESEVAGLEPTDELSQADDIAAVPTEEPSETGDVAAVPTEQPAEAEEVAGAETEQMPQIDLSALKASALMGYDVMNTNGEDIGEIEDMLIGLDSGTVRYAVLTYGGFLDIGDKKFAIPVSAFNFDPQQDAFVLNVEEQMLENAPGFNEDNWPDTASPEWDIDVRDFWQGQITSPETEDVAQQDAATQDQGATQEQDVAEGEGAAEQDQDVAQGTDVNQQDTAGQQQDQVAQQEGQDVTRQEDTMMAEAAVRASDLLDYNIQDLQGEELGQIEDLIVNMNNEMVDFVVVSLSDAVAEGDNLYALRLDELDPQTDQGYFVYNQDVANLQNAPTFSQDQWDEDQVSVNVEGLGSISQ